MTNEPPLDGPAALTTFIETCYHQAHRAQLPDLAALALKVEQGHGASPDAAIGLDVLLQSMIGTLEVHMKKEELIPFPAIRRGGGLGLETPSR